MDAWVHFAIVALLSLAGFSGAMVKDYSVGARIVWLVVGIIFLIFTVMYWRNWP